VRRIDAIFDVEREINGLSAEQRHAIRQVRAVIPQRHGHGSAHTHSVLLARRKM
jgi:hypothetical protein